MKDNHLDTGEGTKGGRRVRCLWRYEYKYVRVREWEGYIPGGSAKRLYSS